MASKYSIEAVFKLVDSFTRPLRVIESTTASVTKGLRGELEKTQNQLKGLGKSFASVAKMGVGIGIGAVTAGLAVATRQYIDFDDALKKSGALFKDLDPLAGNFYDSLDAIGKKSREVAAVTEFNAVDTAGAMQKMAMAGMTSTVAMDLLQGTTDLATAAGTDLTTAVDIATDALGTFNLLPTAENLQRVSDVMAKTASTANTDLMPMFEAITYAGPSFTTAGQSVETLSAAIGILANAGIKGSVAGTSLNAVFTQLGKADKRGALQKIGVQVEDAEGNFLNLFDIIGQLEKKMEGWGAVEKKSFLNKIFDIQGEKAVTLLLNQGGDALKKYMVDLENSSGAAATMAGVMRSSLRNQIEVLKSGLTELGFKFVEAFKTRGSKALDDIIKAVESFDPQAIIDFAVKAVDRFGKLAKTLWEMKDYILALVAGWGAFKAAMVAAAVIQPIIAFAGAVRALMVAQQGMNVAQAAFNVLASANPIGLIATGIAALTALIVAGIKHWDTWGKVVVGGLFPIVSVVKTLYDNWERLKNSFKEGGFLEGIKTLFGTILSGLLAPLQGLLDAIGNIPGIGIPFQNAADKMAEFQASLMGASPSAALPPVAAGLSGVTGAERMMAAKAAAARGGPGPITSKEVATWREESVSKSELYVGLEDGLTARGGTMAPDITVETIRSGY